MKSKKNKSSGDSQRKPEAKKFKNLLVMRPVRAKSWKYDEEEGTRAVILIPRFETKWGKKLGDMYRMKQHRMLHLDDYGTAVWKLCNGRATVRQIGEVLSSQFGESVEPLYERLTEFLKILERNDLIKYKELKIAKKKRKSE